MRVQLITIRHRLRFRPMWARYRLSPHRPKRLRENSRSGMIGHAGGMPCYAGIRLTPVWVNP